MTEPTDVSVAPPIERRIEVAPGVFLHAEQRMGERAAAPFVLVHGLASNVRLWDGVAAHLHALGLERPVLAGQSWGGTVVLEAAWERPEAVRGVACIDGGVVDLAQSYPVWEDCLAKLTPPALDHLTLAELEARIRKGVPHFRDDAVRAYLHCFRTRADGTIEARLSRSHHLSILRSLWEHRPSSRWASLKTQSILMLADSGDPTRTGNKRRAEAAAPAAGGPLRSTWFSPGHHDLPLEFPSRVGDVLARAVREGFFA